MVRLLFRCDWCKETMEEEYMMFWRVVNGKNVDVSSVHLKCEEDFMEAHGGYKRWQEKFCEPMPEIYIDPEMDAWRAEKRAAAKRAAKED